MSDFDDSASGWWEAERNSIRMRSRAAAENSSSAIFRSFPWFRKGYRLSHFVRYMYRRRCCCVVVHMAPVMNVHYLIRIHRHALQMREHLWNYRINVTTIGCEFNAQHSSTFGKSYKPPIMMGVRWSSILIIIITPTSSNSSSSIFLYIHFLSHTHSSATSPGIADIQPIHPYIEVQKKSCIFLTVSPDCSKNKKFYKYHKFIITHVVELIEYLGMTSTQTDKQQWL